MKFSLSFQKNLGIYLVGVLLLVGSHEILAQPFFGYQTTGTQTYYLSLSWDGKEPSLGVGYNYRFFGTSYTDLGAEWRVPINNIQSFDNHFISLGAYRPLSLSRFYHMVGVHARLRIENDQPKENTNLGLAVSYLPGYVYSAPLDAAPYGAISLRATYEATFVEFSKEDESNVQNWFPKHGVELGGHFDIHLQRTYSIAINSYTRKDWSLDPATPLEEDDSDWEFQSDFYLGSTYQLERF